MKPHVIYTSPVSIQWSQSEANMQKNKKTKKQKTKNNNKKKVVINRPSTDFLWIADLYSSDQFSLYEKRKLPFVLCNA